MNYETGSRYRVRASMAPAAPPGKPRCSLRAGERRQATIPAGSMFDTNTQGNAFKCFYAHQYIEIPDNFAPSPAHSEVSMPWFQECSSIYAGVQVDSYAVVEILSLPLSGQPD